MKQGIFILLGLYTVSVFCYSMLEVTHALLHHLAAHHHSHLHDHAHHHHHDLKDHHHANDIALHSHDEGTSQPVSAFYPVSYLDTETIFGFPAPLLIRFQTTSPGHINDLQPKPPSPPPQTNFVC